MNRYIDSDAMTRCPKGEGYQRDRLICGTRHMGGKARRIVFWLMVMAEALASDRQWHSRIDTIGNPRDVLSKTPLLGHSARGHVRGARFSVPQTDAGDRRILRIRRRGGVAE